MDIYLISIIIGLGFIITVLELVRKNSLHEKYSFLWILMSTLLLVLALVPGLIDILARWLKIINPPSLLFLLGLMYLLFYNLHLTSVISKQADKITKLAQEFAMLKKEERPNVN